MTFANKVAITLLFTASFPTVALFAETAVASKAVGPRLEFSETVFDFKRARSSEVLRHEFTVTNSGDAPLEIWDVKPSCECTSAGAWDPVVLPGRSAKIPIEFRPAGFIGPQVKTITVSSNDPVHPSFTLEIRATIWQPIEIQPPQLYFTPIDGEAFEQTKTAIIINNLDEPLALEPLARSASRAFRLELAEVERGKRFELRVTYVATVKPAVVTEGITLKTSSRESPVIRVSASVMPQPAVALIPSEITVPSGAQADGFVHSQIVVNNSREPLKITGALLDGRQVEVEITEPKPGKMTLVKVSFPAGFQVSPGHPSVLTLQTSSTRFPALTVPIETTAPATKASP